MSRARIKVNVASPASFTTPGSKADAEHACPRTRMQHHATTHDHTHKRRSTPPPHCSRMLTSLPGLTSRSRATPAQAHVAKANEIRVWACEMRNIPKLLRRHARIRSTLLTQPARRQKEAHLLVLVGEPVHTDFVTRNSHGKRFRAVARAHPM